MPRSSGEAPVPRPPPSFVSSIQASPPSTPDEGDSIELQIQPIRSGPRNEELATTTARSDIHHGDAPNSQEPSPSRIARSWNSHIAVIVPGATARDHLALERTYLSYHRTSLVLSLIGVVVTQLQVLQRAPNPDPKFGFYVLGKPLAATLVLCAMCTSVLGWLRWWHWQRILLRGKAISGGWELSLVGILVGLLLTVLFGLILAVDVKKIYFS